MEPQTAPKKKTDGELREIMKQLMDNPEDISKIPDEDIIEIKKRINPIGTFAPETKSHAVMSIINMKDIFMRQFLTTSIIGFAYRRLSEYRPAYITAMEEDYARRINAITEGDNVQERRDAMREECARKVKQHTDAHRTVARDFLDSVFRFNPDRHVRRAPSELPTDAYEIITGIKEPSPDAAPPSAAETELDKITEEALREATASLTEDIKKYNAPPAIPTPTPIDDVSRATYEAAGLVYRQARAASGSIAQAYRMISEEKARIESGLSTLTPLDVNRPAELEDTRRLLMKFRARIDDAASTVGPFASERSIMETQNVLQISPPADVFHHLGRYIDTHYEILHILTQLIYRTPPGIENIVIYYDTFDDEAKAKEYIRTHEAEFRADPKVIENGAVTILGPFRENREQVDFYNRHTEALRLMMEQVEKDQKLGKDLTKKRIMDAKRKAGPDDQVGLDRYMSARGIVSAFGKQPALKREEREKLVAAEQTLAEYGTPDGALAIRVLAPTLDEDGVPSDLKQAFFYAEGANVARGDAPGADAGTPGAGSAASAK
jgi:hypothetical protein